MIDKTSTNKNKKSTTPVSFRIDSEIKEKWYQMAEADRRRPVNWFEVVIEEKWDELKAKDYSNENAT